MISAQPKILLLLDFDGTISPIVADPKDARLPKEMKDWLVRVSKSPAFKVGIVTGRGLKDVRSKVGIPNLIYSANHGAQIFYKGKMLLEKDADLKKPLHKLALAISKRIKKMKGVALEDKGQSVAVHYRRAKKSLHKTVREIVKSEAEPILKKYDLRFSYGKMVIEVRRAHSWNKGSAVLWIWKHMAPNYVPIYIGDDITDEDAFLALKDHGLTIRIGRKKDSHAQFCIRSIKTFANSELFQ